MFKEDKGMSNFQQLIQECKKYIELQKEYVKLEITEKLTAIFSMLILVMLILILGMVVLFYLSLSLAHLLAPHVGGLTVGYVIIAGIILLCTILIYIFRNKLIVTPIVNFIANLFLKDSKK